MDKNIANNQSIQGFSRGRDSLIPEENRKESIKSNEGAQGNFFASGNKIVFKTDAYFGHHSTLDQELLKWLKPNVRQEITSPLFYYQIFNRLTKRRHKNSAGNEEKIPEQAAQILIEMETNLEQLNNHLLTLRKN